MTNGGAKAFFSQNGEVFIGNDPARSPWDPASCHAGPPAGLIARAQERLLREHRLVRLAVNLQRPIPIDGFTVSAEVVKAGANAGTSRATLVGIDGRTCAVAEGLHLRPSVQEPMPTPTVDSPEFESATSAPFPITSGFHDQPMFGNAVEARYPPGESPEPGPTTLWLRTPPLLGDETPSPFQRLCPLADSGNAISRNAELCDVTFVNADLIVSMHRSPSGEWFGSRAVSHWHPDGIGMADAELFDRFGPVGRATQTLLLRRAS